jgi:hypothetical protein
METEHAMADPHRPPRRRVDLRLLPPLARTALALLVIVAVSLAAWWTGRDDPVPPFITNVLVPLLGWLWLALAAFAFVSWWRRRRKGAQDAGRRSPP